MTQSTARTERACFESAVEALHGEAAVSSMMDAFRSEWERAKDWGLVLTHALPPMDGGMANAARDNAFDHYYRPYGRGIERAKHLRLDSYAAIAAAEAHHRSLRTSRPAEWMRKRLIERDGDACWLCGDELDEDITIEHRVPKSRGGTWAIGNLVLCHRACNRLMGNAGPRVKDMARDVRTMIGDGE